MKISSSFGARFISSVSGWIANFYSPSRNTTAAENQVEMSDDEVHSVSGNIDASDSASIATVSSSKSETPSVAAASKKRKSTKKKSDGYSRPKKRTKAAAKEEEEEEYEVEMIVDHKLEDVSLINYYH